MDRDDRPCEIEGCAVETNAGLAGCSFCMTHMCQQHLSDHTCLSLQWDEQEKRLEESTARNLRKNYDGIDPVHLVRLAEHLRPGHTCILHPPKSLDSHGFHAGLHHIHLQLEFDDGVKWWARIRQQGFEKPRPAMAKVLMDGEIRTLKLMYEAGLEVPRAWTTDEDTRGLNLFFVEHLEGVGWREPHEPHRTTDEITLQDYAKFTIALSELAFKGVGSIESLEPVTIGPLRSYAYHQSQPPYFLGPHKSLGAHYLVWLERDMGATAKGDRRHHPSSVGWYLRALELKKMIENDPELSDEVGPTYLRHGDAWGGDIMRTDKEGHLTGIIDWEFSWTVPKAAAFSAPIFCMDPDKFWYGNIEPTKHELLLAKAYDDLGRSDLGDCVRNGKKYQLLEVLPNCMNGWNMWSALIESMIGARPVEGTLKEWEAMARIKFADNEGLKQVIRVEEEREKAKAEKSSV